MNDLDADGFPIMLAGGEATRPVPTRSGNPVHGVGTGRFGNRGEPPPKPGAKKPSLEQESAANASEDRRRDAAVDASRQLATLSPEAIREFMTRRWAGRRAMTPADIDEFTRLVQAQRIDDLTDALDSRLRRQVHGGKVARTAVKVEPPRGWIKTSLKDIEPAALQQVLLRLRARGWSETDLTRHVLKPFGQHETKIPPLGLDDYV